MENLLKDLRYAVRVMVRAPVLTTLALLSLALGIGANTSIFTLINAVFLRPLPLESPEELMVVYGTDSTQGEGGRFMPISRPNFEDYRDRNEVFAELIDITFTGAGLSRGGGEAQPVGLQLVTGNYFRALGVRPVLGRGFLPEEDEVPGRDPVAVLSHGLWQEQFGADPAAVGETVSLNGQPFTVVGVAPEGFNGTFALASPDLWVPSMMYGQLLNPTGQEWFTDRRALFTFVAGRLAPGVSREAAEASLQVIGKRLEEEYPVENKGRNVALMPLSQASVPPQLRGAFVRAGALLMVVVGLVLLIACANVANLLLAQAMGRRKEIAVRLSMGAGRRRLVRQLLSESVLLGLAAGALGLVVAFWGRRLLWSMRPPGLEAAELDLSFDPAVLAFTLGVALATGFLFGLWPAFQATRPDVVDDLKEGSRRSGGATVLSFRNLLVMAQVALSFIALMGSGLFLRSLGNAMEIDPGFDTEKLAVLSVNAGAVGYDRPRGEQYFDEVLARARSVPGVGSATLAAFAPLAGGGMLRTVLVDGRDPAAENNSILTQVYPIGADYFETTGIPLLRGRAFSALDREDAPYAAIFNETAAERFWPGEEALGKPFHFFGEDWNLRVVGIAKDSKYNAIGEEPQSLIYLPRWQHYAPVMSLLLRAEGDPDAVLATVRNEVQQLERNMPITNVATMREVVRQSLWAPRMGANLLGLLGGLALVLALAGIYGVMAHTVHGRRREIGIRMALGARTGDVLGLLVSQGMRVVAVGLAVGLVVAWLGSRAIQSLLFGIEGTDLATFALTTVILAVVAFLANLLPARRAAAIDPVVVLKSER